MDTDRPDEDAYGRVTNPERFQVVADAARSLLEELVERYDVAEATGRSSVDFPTWRVDPAETIRLTPREGAPLAFLITDFPGVAVRFGEWRREAFPGCGCDACDESPADMVQKMRDLVEAAVDGRYVESLTRRRLRTSFAGAWGVDSSERRLARGERQSLGNPAVHRWPAWPRR